jgi:hypothetical protein
VNHQGIPLIALLQGVGTFEINTEITLYVNPHRFFIYDRDRGNLIAKTHQA